ncbi:MAG: hypothetical protein IJF76_01615 [Clostridia bacterium]|nr:hypothetical protein [Clostridia bacterium]
MKKIIVSDITPVKAEELNKNLSFREKLAIASATDASGADYINLPALIDSKENEVIYRTVAESVKNVTISVDVGDTIQSIESAYECVKSADKKTLIVSFPVSTAQMEYIYHKKASAMLDTIKEICSKAVEYAPVEFVARDAFRAEDGFIELVAKTVKEIGAFAITVSDEAGIALPEDYANIVKKIKGAADIQVFVETNDKLSMSASCAIEAIKAGADGVKTTMVGDGLATQKFSDIIRAKGIDLDIACGLDVTRVHEIVSSVEDAGVKEEEAVKVSDKLDQNATIAEVSAYAKKLGYDLSDEDNGKVYEEFKRVVRKTESMGAREMEAIIASTAMQVPSTYHLVNYIVNSGNVIPPTANIILEKNGEKLSGVATGDGPIDAAFQAIEQVIGHHYELDDFQVHSVTKGREAVGSSIIRLRANGKLYSGNGVSTDIIGACIRAFINALNKIIYEEN